MPRLRKRDLVLHCLPVTDLTDEDHIRRLAQRVLQCVVPATGIYAHLTLVDNRLLVAVYEFHGIFNGDDVATAIAVAVIDKGGERCRLARAGCAHKQHQAALAHNHFGERARQSEIPPTRDISNNVPGENTHLVALHEYIDAKAAIARNRCGQIHFELLLEFRALRLVHYLVVDLLDLAGSVNFTGDGFELSLEFGTGRRTRTEKQI